MPIDKKPETRVIVEEITAPINEPEEEKDIKPEKEVKPVEKKVENKSAANFNIFWIILPGIMLLGLLMGGIVAYYSGLNKLKSSETATTKNTTPQPIITVESSPSASPVSKIDLTKYKIKVLNGSGIKGEAGKAEDLLEKAGFVVQTTGNAKTYDYQKTIIQAKTGVEENFLASLKKTLSQTYKLDKNETLKDSETSSVVVIVGTSKSN